MWDGLLLSSFVGCCFPYASRWTDGLDGTAALTASLRSPSKTRWLPRCFPGTNLLPDSDRTTGSPLGSVATAETSVCPPFRPRCIFGLLSAWRRLPSSPGSGAAFSRAVSLRCDLRRAGTRSLSRVAAARLLRLRGPALLRPSRRRGVVGVLRAAGDVRPPQSASVSSGRILSSPPANGTSCRSNFRNNAMDLPSVCACPRR